MPLSFRRSREKQRKRGKMRKKRGVEKGEKCVNKGKVTPTGTDLIYTNPVKNLPIFGDLNPPLSRFPTENGRLHRAYETEIWPTSETWLHARPPQKLALCQSIPPCAWLEQRGAGRSAWPPAYRAWDLPWNDIFDRDWSTVQKLDV